MTADFETPCDGCGIIGKRLFNGIIGIRPVKLCGKCIFQENPVLLNKPSEEQIRKVDESIEVYKRLAREGGYKIELPKSAKRMPEELRKAIDEETPKSNQLNVVDKFEEILNQKMSEKQISAEELAKQINTHPDIIKEAKKGFLKDEDTARKLETFFEIQLFEEKKISAYLKKRLEESPKLEKGDGIDFNSKNLTILDLKRMHDEKMRQRQEELKKGNN